MDDIGNFVVVFGKDGSKFVYFSKNGIESYSQFIKKIDELEDPSFRQSFIDSWEKIVRNDIRILEDEVYNRNEALKKLEENITRDQAKKVAWLKDKQNLEDRILVLKQSLP